MMRRILLTVILAAAAATTTTVDAAELCGNITSSETWPAGEHMMTCQVFVNPGATLTIEPGATIKAQWDEDTEPAAPALVIERGAKIMADGTKDEPITFTTTSRTLPMRGTWGGVIVLGNAPISTEGGENFVEGLEAGGAYGGDDPEDDSGVLRYVRIWYGGAVIGKDNEINGLTLAGVGNGTTVEFIEVAFNLDDGIELFGGTVNLKYISVLFCGDDAIDTDEGYQGKIQFAFVMVGTGAGHHGVEMDSKTNGDVDSSPRSHPQLYNALFIGSDAAPSAESSDDLLPSVMRFREGTGGQFANIIITNLGSGAGVLQNECGSEDRVQDMRDAGTYPDFLYFSPNNIINSNGTQEFLLDASCTGLGKALNVDPELMDMPTDAAENIAFFDPRPRDGGRAYDDVDDVPDDGFFEPVDFKGAFGPDLWLQDWSWLQEDGRIPKV